MMKKMMICIFTVLVLCLSAVPALASPLGGWDLVPHEAEELPEDAQEAFDKAAENLDDAEYTPVELLATQVAAGMNYCILCQKTSDDDKGSWALVYIYADPEGNVETTNVYELYIAMHSTPEDGKNDMAQNPAEEGIVINNSGKEIPVAWDYIAREPFEGKLVNAKGETFFDKFEGAELKKLLADHGVELSENSVVTVTAEDGYTAEFTGAELLENGKVYIALYQNGKMIEDDEVKQSARIIVFGDPDSKRTVKSVKSISVR